MRENGFTKTMLALVVGATLALAARGADGAAPPISHAVAVEWFRMAEELHNRALTEEARKLYADVLAAEPESALGASAAKGLLLTFMVPGDINWDACASWASTNVKDAGARDSLCFAMVEFCHRREEFNRAIKLLEPIALRDDQGGLAATLMIALLNVAEGDQAASADRIASLAARLQDKVAGARLAFAGDWLLMLPDPKEFAHLRKVREIGRGLTAQDQPMASQYVAPRLPTLPTIPMDQIAPNWTHPALPVTHARISSPTLIIPAPAPPPLLVTAPVAQEARAANAMAVAPALTVTTADISGFTTVGVTEIKSVQAAFVMPLTVVGHARTFSVVDATQIQTLAALQPMDVAVRMPSIHSGTPPIVSIAGTDKLSSLTIAEVGNRGRGQ